MLSSKKILYLIILSLVVVCGINGIDYYAGAYDNTANFTDEIITFSDSGFFGVPDYIDSTVAIVSDDGGSDSYNNADIYVPENDYVPEDTPDIVTLEEDVSVTTTRQTTTTATTATTTVFTAVPTSPTVPTTQYVPVTQDYYTTTSFTTTTTTTTTTWFTTTTTTASQFMTTTAEPFTTTEATTTTTTTRVYYDSGSVHFEYPTIRIYAGASVNVELNFPIGAQRRATFSSKDTTVAIVSNFDDTTASINGLSVGTAWIQGTSSSGETAYCKVIVTDFAEEVIRLTNIERMNNGLPELTKGSPLVQSVANTRLSESSTYFNHTRPDGRKFSTAAADIGLTYGKIGENLASGQTSPEQVVREWMNSPTHRANILDAGYSQICVSYGIGGDGMPYWIQIFYEPLG